MNRTLELINAKMLFNTREAAHYLGVTVAKLRNSRYTGELYGGVATPRYHKFGRSVMYRKSTLDEWLASLPEYSNTADYHRGI